MKNEKMKVTLWGTRGSIPCPTLGQYETAKYGGNTTCVEINGPQGSVNIVDMGSGMRPLGNSLFGRGFAPAGSGVGAGRANIFQSHLHHDHTQGLGFFGPIFIPGNKFNFYSGEFEVPFEQALRQVYSKPWFPITLDEMAAAKKFKELSSGRMYEMDDLVVQMADSNHPDKCYGYKFMRPGEFGRTKSVVYLIDNEHDPASKRGNLSELDKKIVKFMKDADLVLLDSTYTPQEYAGQSGPRREGWGHSTYDVNILRLSLIHI